MHIKVIWIAFFAFVSLSGMFFHNSDLQHLTLLSPENSFPALISISLFVLWWVNPNKITTKVFIFWALLNLVGGLLSAIPFDFWELGKLQTEEHLLKHAVYALAQFPLIIGLHTFK